MHMADQQHQQKLQQSQVQGARTPAGGGGDPLQHLRAHKAPQQDPGAGGGGV
jgi:hypothetical protein